MNGMTEEAAIELLKSYADIQDVSERKLCAENVLSAFLIGNGHADLMRAYYAIVPETGT
jgi:hypothetical protein